jgi:hypothetical protein
MVKKKNSSEYKARATKLLDRLGEYESDLQDILTQLEELRVACMTGIKQEKVSVTDGVLTVIEIYPQVALSATMGKLSVYKELSRLSELEEPEDKEVIISFMVQTSDDAESLKGNKI